MKIKIEIKHWVTGAVLFEFEKENNTIKDTVVEANLRGADLRGAKLRGAKLEKLPQDYINQCSRDILFILEHLKRRKFHFSERN